MQRHPRLAAGVYLISCADSVQLASLGRRTCSVPSQCSKQVSLFEGLVDTRNYDGREPTSMFHARRQKCTRARSRARTDARIRSLSRAYLTHTVSLYHTLKLTRTPHQTSACPLNPKKAHHINKFLTMARFALSLVFCTLCMLSVWSLLYLPRSCSCARVCARVRVFGCAYVC